MVGIYISAHPLDDYAVILQDVCNTQVMDLKDIEKLDNSDITLGGMVTAVRKGVGKSGRPYGFVTIEDYSGAFEISFFGQDWATWSSYMDEGNTLYITGKCQPRQWKENQKEFKIGKIEFLADVQDSLIESITISIELSRLNNDLILSLTDEINASPGTADLYFQIVDPLGQMNVTLQSKTKKVSVKKDLISFIQSKQGLSYKIN